MAARVRAVGIQPRQALEHAMDTQVSIIDSTSLLIDGEILTGTIKKPFIQDGKLMGAVLSFEGKAETALLHRKQMIGSNRDFRLANLKLGDQLTVKLIVSGVHPDRKSWASETNVEDAVVVERLMEQRSKTFSGRVVNAADYGVFIELCDGPGAGRRGLVHAKNLCKNGAASLSAFTAFAPGALVKVDLISAHIDERNIVRIDLGMVA
jgi:ribosomal protein S1